MMNVQNKFYKFSFWGITIDRKDILNFLVSVFGIIIANIELFEIMSILKIFSYKIIVYDILICSVIIFMNIYGITNKRNANKNRIDIEQLKQKNESLLEVSDDIRCFKHDFNNIMQAIDGYLFLDDMNSLQIYFKSLLGECNHVKVIDNLNSRVKDNPAIYGVLLNKFKLAEERNITMNVDILDGLDKVEEKSYIIARILGILLDNALEATNECSDKIVNVQFLTDDENKRNIIVIENTYANKDIDTCKIFEKNYTTKKEKGNSGLGLWKIHNILCKDSSFELFTTKNETMFKQQLEIYR